MDPGFFLKLFCKIVFPAKVKGIQFFFLNFFCKIVFPAKVKGIRLPWDIKVKPLAMATAEMESSKALNRNSTEISLGIQLGTDTVEPESSVQIVSKAALETTGDMSETDTAEMTREVDLKVTSKTFMESSMAVTEEIGVKSSTTNIRPKTDTSKANPHSMEANLKVKMKISEKSEEGNYQHSGVSTESPQRVLRRGIYQRLLPHNQGHHQQQQQQHNGG